MTISHPASASLLLAVALASTALDTRAQVALRTTTHAAGACQAALPAYEGAFRKRPLAVVNEGTGTAFLTCAFPGFEGGTFGGLTIWFSNFGNSPAIVNCTFVTGTAATGVPHAVEPVYINHARELAAGASDALFLNSLQANGDAPTSVSCALPPQVGIGDLQFGQEIGSGP